MRARIPLMFPRPVPAAAPPRPYTVSGLTAEVASMLRTTWRDVAVVGEIARFDLRGGHGYFLLKDKTATISAIIFASDLQRIPFRLEPGLEVVVRGSLDLYTPQGKFQIKAFAIEPVGRGALQLAFEPLKARLAGGGLFAPAPDRVQGELAAREIVLAIRRLNAHGGFDVLILARGGGSPEDLAPFNDEAVA